MAYSGEDFLSSDCEFTSLMSNALTNPGFEQLFGVAFVLTVETGFIPISLTEYFDTINSNIELAKMIQNSPLNTFWYQNDNIFTAQLSMFNRLCYLTGVPNSDSLIVTLSYSDISRCILIEHNILNKKLIHLSIKYKNLVCVPVKCAVLEISMYAGQYPYLCGISEELILYIMAKLDVSDLYALMRSNRKMNYLAVSNQSLWKKFMTKEFKNVEFNQKTQPITDWRKHYYELRREKFGRKRTIIIRE